MGTLSSNNARLTLWRDLVTRRNALVSAAAAALVLAPTAAMAYDAPGFQSQLSDTTPATGTPFSFDIAGNEDIAGETVVLTVTTNPASIPNSAIQIAGTKSASKVANANGDVKFSVTLTEAGTYNAVATVGDVTIATQDFGVAAAASATSNSASSNAASSGKAVASGKALAETGFDGAGLATGAGALVLAGAGAVMIAKRRQSAAI